jgi:hypothetical protein
MTLKALTRDEKRAKKLKNSHYELALNPFTSHEFVVSEAISFASDIKVKEYSFNVKGVELNVKMLLHNFSNLN